LNSKKDETNAKEILTDFDSICYIISELNEDEAKMKGNIRAKGVCPVCKKKFKHLLKLGYVCNKCKTQPIRYYIDLYYKGRRLRIFSDKSGQSLDSYQRTKNILAHINYELDNHIFNPDKYIKEELEKFWLTNLLDNFLKRKLPSIAPSYKKHYVHMVSLAKDYFANKDVRELRKMDIINYKEHLEKNFNIKSKTIKNILDHFKTFLNYLKNDLELIDTIPSFPEIELVPYKFKWLSQEDQRKLFELVAEEHKPIIGFLMLHGCRPSEARALKCRDVNLNNQTITISATFSDREYRERRKGRGSKPVTIPIHPEILDYIEQRVKNSLPEAWLFMNRYGRHYSENALRRIWNDVRSKAGISKELRLYDATRHSLASQLVNQGTSLFVVSKLLGHSSIEMTEKYAHPNIESLRAELNKLSLKEIKTVTKLSPDKNLAKKAL